MAFVLVHDSVQIVHGHRAEQRLQLASGFPGDAADGIAHHELGVDHRAEKPVCLADAVLMVNDDELFFVRIKCDLMACASFIYFSLAFM